MPERLDKVLAQSAFGTRSEVRRLILSGRVRINGAVPKRADFKVDPQNDEICVDGNPIHARRFLYLMMNKPAGVLSATTDRFAKTVLSLLPDEYQTRGLFPVGRLDRDTTGLLLLTNDGETAHCLLSPKKHVEKDYLATLNGTLTPADVEIFKRGVLIDGGYICKSAVLQILHTGAKSEALVTITEGKFHQVKRMFEAVGKPVLSLKRQRMGPLLLDEALAPGAFRALTDAEEQSILAVSGN